MGEITTRTVDLGGAPELSVVPNDPEDMTLDEMIAAALDNPTPEPTTEDSWGEENQNCADESVGIRAVFFKSEPYIAFVIPTELGPADHVLRLEDAMTLRGVLGDEIEKALANG